MTKIPFVSKLKHFFCFPLTVYEDQPYSPEAVANFFIDLAKTEKVALNTMKVKGLVYFSHGWFLAILNKPLINERVEVWEFGPVIPSLYRAFKSVGTNPITIKATRFDRHLLKTITPLISKEDQTTTDLLERVWYTHKHLSGIQMSNCTHQEGTPWYQVRIQLEGGVLWAVPDTLIQKYFKEYRG